MLTKDEENGLRAILLDRAKSKKIAELQETAKAERGVIVAQRNSAMNNLMTALAPIEVKLKADIAKVEKDYE